MHDTNFLHDGTNQGYWLVKALAQVPFTEADSTDCINQVSDLREAIEYSIEMKGFTQPLPSWRKVIGKDMPMSELGQILHRMVETGYRLPSFDLDAAIQDIRANRNS
jgi:septation ring formation regulator EzrA